MCVGEGTGTVDTSLHDTNPWFTATKYMYKGGVTSDPLYMG